MNKVIFQIGLLVFCMSIVYFGTQGLSAMEMISRSFMVFMIAIAGIVVLAMFAVISLKKKATMQTTQEARGSDSKSRKAGTETSTASGTPSA
jgi:Co/Zn/Cd efflux system component